MTHSWLNLDWLPLVKWCRRIGVWKRAKKYRLPGKTWRKWPPPCKGESKR